MPTPVTTPTPPTTPPAPVEPAPVIAPLFGAWWPERSRLARPGLVLAAIAIGVLGGLLLPHRPVGVALLLVLLLAGGTVLRVASNRETRWSRAYAVVATALACLVVVRAAEWLTVLALAVAGVLLTTALTDARSLGAMVAGWVSWVFSGIRGLPLLGRSLDTMTKYQALWPIVRTAGLSLVALVVFGGLFASGDALFGSWAAAVVPDLAVDGFVERGFVAFVIAGVVLAACYLAINPPEVNRVRLPGARTAARPWEWLVPVGLVIAMFAVFVIAQAAAMWGGHDYVQRVTGLTYAEYGRSGFGQLVLVTSLTLVTVALAARKAARETERERWLLRGALGVLCLLALVVVASALHRMAVYQEAYGYTVLRVLVDAFELWLGLVLVLVLIAGLRLDGAWIPRVALLSGAIVVLGIGLANPEAWVAQRNIDRYAASQQLDTDYLASLGPDAMPTIVNGLPPELAACSVSAQPDLGEDWLSWNLGRHRAADISIPEPTEEQVEACWALAP